MYVRILISALKFGTWMLEGITTAFGDYIWKPVKYSLLEFHILNTRKKHKIISHMQSW